MTETATKRQRQREAMPLVSAFIDDMRAAFGTDTIHQAIRNGMAGGCDFYASENGVELGSKAPNRGTIVSLADMVLTPTNDNAATARKSARRGK